MKTKKKILALLEIAVVLCSVFLVAIPSIAADQTTQGASASKITTASEDEYILEIYGNANEDDTIDMRDFTYTARIILEIEDETTLADADYGGDVNVGDMTQIGLIILGREKELTLIDSGGRIVTVEKPLERIVVTFRQALELIRTVKLEPDRVVGVESLVQSSGGPPYWSNYKIFFPEYQDKPTVGLIWTPDVEAILNLYPDVVFVIDSPKLDACQDVLESAGITVIRVYGGVWEGDITDEAKKFAYIFDKHDEADEFIEWYRDVMNSIEETVEEIPEEDKPTVYFESGTKWNAADESRAHVGSAGGKNIFEEGGMIEAEAVADRNPDIIVTIVWKSSGSGYDMDAGDTAKLDEIRDELMSRKELEHVKAVEDKRVYVISGYIIKWGPTSGCRGFLQIAYMAKWFHHPELFTDLDPKAIHQEYLTRFQQLDYNLDEKGVFVYPEPK